MTTPKNPPMQKRSKRLVIAAVVASGAIVSSVVSAAVVTQCVDEPLPSQGVINPAVIARAVVVPTMGVADVRSMAEGHVANVHVREGDFVTKGAPLAELINVTIEAELARRRAEQKSAEATATSVEQGARQEEKLAANAAVDEVNRQVLLAKDRLERQEKMALAGAATESSIVELKAALSVAQAQLASAQARAKLVHAGGKVTDVMAARSHAQGMAAAVNAAQFSADQLTIVAPISGTVLSRSIDPGDVVSQASLSNNPLFEIADISKLELKIEIEEQDSAAVTTGLQVEFIAPQTHPVSCTVERVSPRLMRRTISVEDARTRADSLVRAAWCTVDALSNLVVGQRFDVRISLPHVEVSSVAPRSNILVKEGKTALRTPTWYGEKLTTVTVGRSDDAYVEILAAPSSQ